MIRSALGDHAWMAWERGVGELSWDPLDLRLFLPKISHERLATAGEVVVGLHTTDFLVEATVVEVGTGEFRHAFNRFVAAWAHGVWEFRRPDETDDYRPMLERLRERCKIGP